MMPLVYAQPGEINIIRKVGGNPEIRRHLENLGFVAGSRMALSLKTVPRKNCSEKMTVYSNI